MNDERNDHPGLWRLGVAARKAGMTAESLEAAAKAGTIPVEVIRTSPRLAFVRAEAFQAWLKGTAK